jgi:outer membrane protein assembly factor BamB
MKSFWPRPGVAVAILLLAWTVPPALAFIEHKVLLQDLLKDCDYIFRAKIESVDPARPAMVLVVDKDFKGRMPARRLPINLTGDKEKHTPELLKRIAPELPVVCFDLVENDQHMLLVFSNGTWFQVLGKPDGDRIRWAFTHCEIYLRRTFRGTTQELEQVVVDVLAGKRQPPPYDPKAQPGFGPELPAKPPSSEKRPGLGQVSPPPGEPQPRQGRGSLLLGVIALPFLMPVAALLQLLFPALLREQWRQYSIAISVLLTQSTLVLLQWAFGSWLGTGGWWNERVAWFAGTAVAVSGLAASTIRWSRRPALLLRPARVEYGTMSALLLAGLLWAGYQLWTREPPFRDEMGVVSLAAAAGLVHLVVRRWTAASPRTAAPGAAAESAGSSASSSAGSSGRQEERPAPWRSTELVFLAGLSAGGLGLSLSLPAHQAAMIAEEVRGEWPMARGNPQRTGSADRNDPGPQQPQVLWVFDPQEPRGRVLFHSTPTVVDGLLYVGALRQVSAFQSGYLYCIEAASGRQQSVTPLPAGTKRWRFTANDTLRPVFATPIVTAGRLLVGEGYHQDSGCRLLCLDARDASRLLWTFATSSHVESSACVVGSRVYFGAGDDGLYCVDAADVQDREGGPRPRLVWHFPGLHVDVSPLAVEGRVFAGSTAGDRYQDLYAFALDADTGRPRWQRRHELRVTGSPAYAEGRVVFGLGNGKLGQDAAQPQGAVWCLDAADGSELWTLATGNSVMATPAAAGGRIVAPCTDGWCYGIESSSGRLLWKTRLPAPIAASPVVAAGKVYLLTVEGHLSCLDLAEGKVLWSLPPLADGVDDAYASPVLVHGRLYVALGGKVFCIGDASQP